MCVSWGGGHNEDLSLRAIFLQNGEKSRADSTLMKLSHTPEE